MRFNIESKIGARFKLVVHKGDGIPVRETKWFHNLVLDAGLDRMSVGTWIDRCCVGSGNSTPAATQVALDNFVASTTVGQAGAQGVQTTLKPYYRFSRVTWRFGLGVAAGNISEIGLGWGNANLWNRALVKDINNNPTTITVLSDEYLDVVSEVRDYPADSVSGSFDLLDKNGAIVSSHTFIGKPLLTGASPIYNKPSTSTNGYSGLYVCSGEIGANVTQHPSGAYDIRVSSVSSTYPTTRSIRVESNLDLNFGNGVHQSFVSAVDGILTNNYTQPIYQFQITPTITKNNTQTMKYVHEISWGRYEPS